MSCISPFYTQVKGAWMPFPCGRCPPCKKRRVDGWVFRLLQEDKVSLSAFFITLTYDPAHVPISPNGHMTLDKQEFPRFMKRLRKLLPGIVIRYYACGEYGTDFSRPHYHAIVFNVPCEHYFFEAWSLGGVHFGDVHVGRVSADSIAYVAGYINKQELNSPRRDDDRVPQFCLMSKGLGSGYVTDAIREYHGADLERMFLTKPGGDIIAMPRYYRDRIFDEDQRAFQQSLAEKASGVSNSEQYQNFLKLYGHVHGFDFSKYQEAQRLGSVTSFYSNQKSR